MSKTGSTSRRRGYRRSDTLFEIRSKHLDVRPEIERFRIKLLMAHAVDQDITYNSYTNVSALREQLREATETVAAFIVRHAGCNPDAELTGRLQNQATTNRG